MHVCLEAQQSLERCLVLCEGVTGDLTDFLSCNRDKVGHLGISIYVQTLGISTSEEHNLRVVAIPHN